MFLRDGIIWGHVGEIIDFVKFHAFANAPKNEYVFLPRYAFHTYGFQWAT